jgi:hypothetical protein
MAAHEFHLYLAHFNNTTDAKQLGMLLISAVA